MILDFKKIGLNKICAAHLKRNPASGKVMQNIGMEQEGVFKEHVKKWGGKYEDLVYYGMLRNREIVLRILTFRSF